jgi:hypothetical protein
MTPHRCVGASPYSQIKIAPAPRQAPGADDAGSMAVVGMVVMLLCGAVFGYVLGRLDLFGAIGRWLS